MCQSPSLPQNSCYPMPLHIEWQVTTSLTFAFQVAQSKFLLRCSRQQIWFRIFVSYLSRISCSFTYICRTLLRSAGIVFEELDCRSSHCVPELVSWPLTKFSPLLIWKCPGLYENLFFSPESFCIFVFLHFISIALETKAHQTSPCVWRCIFYLTTNSLGLFVCYTHCTKDKHSSVITNCDDW